MSENIFPGFEALRHIALIGTTSAGKTSWVITTLMKENGFAKFDIFVYIASEINDKLEEMRKAVIYHTGKEEDNFVFYKNTDVQNALIYLKNHDKNKTKLVFFDDIQPAGPKIVQLTSQFALEAKNANCTIISSIHAAAEKNGEKNIRDASRYFVLFNQPPDNFYRYASLHGQDKNQALYQKYAAIPGSYYKKIIIIDKDTQKIYYGTGEFKEFNPLINKAV